MLMAPECDADPVASTNPSAAFVAVVVNSTYEDDAMLIAPVPKLDTLKSAPDNALSELVVRPAGYSTATVDPPVVADKNEMEPTVAPEPGAM